MRILLLTLTCLALAASVVAQRDYSRQKDSLHHVVAQTEGEKKFTPWFQLTGLYFNEVTTDPLKLDTLLALYDDIYHEARRQGATATMARVRGNILSAFFNRKDYGEVIRRAPAYLDEVAALGEWGFLYKAHTTLVRAYLYEGDHAKAIDEAQRMYDEANARQSNEGMGMALYAMNNVYKEQNRPEEMIPLCRRSFDLLKDDDALLATSSNVWFDLCQALLALERYDELPEAMATYEEINRRFDVFAGTSVSTSWANLWKVYIRYYMGIRNYDQASLYCDRLDSLQVAHTREMLFDTRSEILFEQGRYEEALAMADRGMKELSASYINNVRVTKRRILERMGRYEEAYRVQGEIMAANDSIRSLDFARQIDDLRTQYEVDRHIAEKERKHLQFVWALTACLLLAVVLTVYIVYSRRLHRKNLALYRQMQNELHRQQADMPLPASPTTPLSRGEGEPGNEVSEEMELFRRLTELVEGEKLFTQADLDRKMLADRMGTNENYISRAIRESPVDSLSSYLSGLRLRYALELMNADPDKTLDAVALESGHGSYTTFYRAFSRHYGMTPSEYKSLRKKEVC